MPEDGWLVLYHGVFTSCNGFVYSMCAALLDLGQPWKVIARVGGFLLAPHAVYEQIGDVPNVVFRAPRSSTRTPNGSASTTGVPTWWSDSRTVT